MSMVVQVFDGLLLGFDGFDPLCLDLLDHLEDVFRVPFQDWKNARVRGWPIRSYQQEQVREILGRDAQVSDGEIAKLLMDFSVVSTINLEMWREGCVKAWGSLAHRPY